MSFAVIANPRHSPGRGYLVYKHLPLVQPKLVFGPTIAAISTMHCHLASRTARPRHLQPAKVGQKSRILWPLAP